MLYEVITDFFGEGPHFSALRGWDFSVPGNDGHPHAPWWHYSPEANLKENPGLSASIAAFILRAAPEQSVITSYSIHYTKLYDARRNSPGSLAAAKVPKKSEGRRKKT